jgi:cystathionine beta-lyase/cystathionine gamma-synthase
MVGHLEVIQDNIKSNTKIIWIETPTNPLLKISSLEEIAQIGKENEILTVVDNTFASPYLQQPANYGIDVVMHSTTKYLGGHSDLVGGVLVSNDEALVEKLRFLQNANGAVPSPFDCWLLSRGIKTLPVRMKRHSENAIKIVEFLQTQKIVDKIYYPFLEDHRDSNIAKKQMKYGGGMLSFDLPTENDAHNFLKHLKLFYLAESLGGVESLAEYPPTMTHGSIPRERRHEIGINDGLVRLSVGIENVEDLINDISQAFGKL